MSDAAFAQIAATAAHAFLARGFKGVSLRALASELGIQAASLYHHCPGGKSELYVRSLQWFLDGYAERLLASRGRAAYPESILRMACFTLGEDHVDLRRIVTSDLMSLPPQDGEALNVAVHEALLRPFVREFDAAKQDGKARKRLDSHLAAACVLAIADNLGGLHLPGDSPSPEARKSAEKLVRAGVALLLDGAQA
jgi:AcrR family transcriptional regulator